MNGQPDQLTRAELLTLDPKAINDARLAGRLADVLAGREPGAPRPCPTCGKPEDLTAG